MELGLKAGRQELEEKWKALRRGWYVGKDDLVEKLKARLGARLAGKRRESHSGGAPRAHGEAAAQKLLCAGLAALGIAMEELRALPKSAPEKTALAWWLRERTTVPLRWVSQELDVGHYTRVTQAVSRMQRKPGRKLENLKRRLLQMEEQDDGKSPMSRF